MARRFPAEIFQRSVATERAVGTLGGTAIFHGYGDSTETG